MSEPEQAVDTTPETLRALGTMCLGVYLSTAPADELYQRAVHAAARRARSLLRAYLQEGTTVLRRPIGPEDRSLFYTCARDALRLAQMGQGVLVLSVEELNEIAERP